MSDELQITLTNDFAFKFFLGSEENKPILQDLLQCILALSPQEVSDIELMDKELAKEELSDKTGILDVKLKLTNGTVIDIEIQASWNASFVKRTLFYWAKMYTADFKAGQSYERLHKCIAINIIADGFTLNDAVHSEYVLQEKYHHTSLTDVLEIHFLNLEAAKKTKEQHTSDKLINWLRFIGATDKKERAMVALKSPILQMLNEKIDIVTLSPVERKLYESRMKLKSDITTIAETQFTAGLAEGEERGKSLGLAEGKSIGLAEGEARGKSLGLAEGIGQGFAEGMRKTARLMKQYNYPLSDISSITGLSKAEIEAL